MGYRPLGQFPCILDRAKTFGGRCFAFVTQKSKIRSPRGDSKIQRAYSKFIPLPQKTKTIINIHNPLKHSVPNEFAILASNFFSLKERNQARSWYSGVCFLLKPRVRYLPWLIDRHDKNRLIRFAGVILPQHLTIIEFVELDSFWDRVSIKHQSWKLCSSSSSALPTTLLFFF